MPAADHAALMDGVYRHQRHIYDLTRRFYLLGRDELVAGLDVPPGGTVLELGCGTGRNLIRAHRAYPDATLFGIDISSVMLKTAAVEVVRQRIPEGGVRLARADATRFDCSALFGREKVDRVFASYTLSMIPNWQQAVEAGLDCLTPGGSLHIVDFGRQQRLPRIFRAGLRRWLAHFHVTPRHDLQEAVAAAACRRGAAYAFRSLCGDYAWLIRITLPL